jgi:hypothetical protein
MVVGFSEWLGDGCNWSGMEGKRKSFVMTKVVDAELGLEASRHRGLPLTTLPRVDPFQLNLVELG